MAQGRDPIGWLQEKFHSRDMWAPKGLSQLNRKAREFPGGPVVRGRSFHCHGPGSAPGPGTEILHAAWAAKKKGGSSEKEFTDK